MSPGPARPEVAYQLEQMATAHESSRTSQRWLLRLLGWGPAVGLWLTVILGEGFVEGSQGCLMPLLIWAVPVEILVALGVHGVAKTAAAGFNQAFPGGSRRDEAASLLLARGQERGERGRAARRFLRALYLPREAAPEEAKAEAAKVPTQARSTVPALDLSRPAWRWRWWPARRPPPGPTIPIEVTPSATTPTPSREAATVPLPLRPEGAPGGQDE